MDRSLLIALIAVAGSCYSPSLGDCTVECAPGDGCPDGLVCSVGFCRPPGASGSCEQPPTPDAPIQIIDADTTADADLTVDADLTPDANKCGDGNVDPGEDCDDMNKSQNDACKNDCSFNICGDNQVRTGVEECDDGNTTSEGTCSRTCLTCGTAASVDATLFSDETNHCYRRSETDRTHAESVTFCAGLSSYPVVLIANSTLNTQLYNFIPTTTGFYWSGAVHVSDASTTDTFWRWPQGGTFTQMSGLWNVNGSAASDPEPDTTPDEMNLDPVVALEKSSFLLRVGLDDKPDTDTNAVICEQDSPLVRSDRHAYIFFPALLSWAAAKTACEGLAPGKSHLATLESAEERTAVRDLAWAGRVWLGGADNGGLIVGSDEDDFRWIGGGTIDNGIVMWGAGAPNAGADNLDCTAFVDPNKTFTDADCALTGRYICEIEP